MTKQEYHDLLKRAAKDGTFPSGDATMCFYRRDETPTCPQRCAVGLLVPDDKYTPDMDSKFVNELGTTLDCNPHVLAAIEVPEGMSVEDLRQVQVEHDIECSVAWNADNFIARINRLPCFADVQK